MLVHVLVKKVPVHGLQEEIVKQIVLVLQLHLMLILVKLMMLDVL